MTLRRMKGKTMSNPFSPPDKTTATLATTMTFGNSTAIDVGAGDRATTSTS